MKSKFLLLAFNVAAFVFCAQATVHTVSNNTFSPGQFTNFQIAVDSATAGDTLYVEPSPYDYGAVNISKQLYVFGGGGTPYTYQFNYSAQVDQVNLSANTSYPYNTASGSVIQGFQVNYPYTINVGAGLKNITVARNYLGYNVNLNGPDTGIVVINNIFSNYSVNLSSSNPNDITALIANNFFDAQNNSAVTERGSNNSQNGVIFSNNMFYGNSASAGNQNTFFSSMDYVTVKNNIFFCDGGAAQSFSSGCSNCNFQNNITYSPNTNLPNGNQVIPDGNNSGTGNFSDENPNFVNGPANYTYVSPAQLYTFNWNVTGAPGHNAGTDGTDIGIYGGPFPMPNLEAVTRLPQVRQLNISNSSVAPNGTLNVNIIGTTRN